MSKNYLDWFEQLPCSLTICDRRYRILYLNAKAAELNSADGGKALVGRNLMDCHPPRAQAKLRKVMASRRPNVYTTERHGKKKLVYQCRWRDGGRVGGLVELSFELPKIVPNFVRT